MLKVVREELGLGRVAHNERPMATHIPYLRHVSDTVINLESGALLSVIKLDGLFFQTEDQAELNMRSVVQNTMIRALGSSRFSLVVDRHPATGRNGAGRRLRRSLLRSAQPALHGSTAQEAHVHQ